MAARQAGDERLGATASFGHLLGRVSHRMSRQVERALATGGLNLEQWRVLHLLADGQGHPMSEIAAYAMVPAPTLTKIVDRLIDSTLVYRRPDDVDRRRILVFLSDHGVEKHDTLALDVERAEHELVAGLTAAELSHLRRLLEGLAG